MKEARPSLMSENEKSAHPFRTKGADGEVSSFRERETGYYPERSGLVRHALCRQEEKTIRSVPLPAKASKQEVRGERGKGRH